MLLDDHALVREVLTRLLEEQSDLRVVASFEDGDVAVRFAARDEPDVAILDVALPGGSGIDVARRLRAVAPRTRLLMLSMHNRAEYVRQALLAGASGYLVKESAGDEVVAAVRAVHGGQRYLGRQIRLCYEDLSEDPLERLSAREMQVLQLVADGNSSREIAARLRISSKSVDTYRSRLMTKLDLQHLADLVKFAIRHGLTSA